VDHDVAGGVGFGLEAVSLELRGAPSGRS
jgi:hypothetical protein